ncbi:Clg1 protein [Starmerella bacillaris]|uniref:Clg1 protein n=1 Tax=Starmerella bacillaris TaxID=1247836 RepID=A0AAV5RHK1_STABA|nr:Clg1 protein [Starmerella bacillaris]
MAQVDTQFQSSALPGADLLTNPKQEFEPPLFVGNNSYSGYNGLVTPSSACYGNMSWSGINMVSPSIWSPNHSGNTQWPEANQIRPNHLGYHSGNYPLYPRSNSSNYPFVSNLYQRANPIGQGIQSNQIQPMVVMPHVNPAPIQNVPVSHVQQQAQHIQQIPQHVRQVQPVQQVVPPQIIQLIPQGVPVQPIGAAHQMTQLHQPQNVQAVPMHMGSSSPPVQVAPMQQVYQPVHAVHSVTQLQQSVPQGGQPYYSQMYPSAPHIASASYVPDQNNQATQDTSMNGTMEYDMQLASKFIVTVASNICQYSAVSTGELQALESYVRSLLCATHLSKATMLVCLIALNRVVEAGINCSHNYSLKKLLIGSFVLANKTNDDNTFTNASWSLVTGLSAGQITSLELSFLDVLGWCFNLNDKNLAEWKYWDACWNEYLNSSQNRYPQSPVSPTIWSQNYGVDSFPVAAC